MLVSKRGPGDTSGLDLRKRQVIISAKGNDQSGQSCLSEMVARSLLGASPAEHTAWSDGRARGPQEGLGEGFLYGTVPATTGKLDAATLVGKPREEL